MTTAGFFSGLWHGFFAVIYFTLSIFTEMRMYSIPNSGLGYDAGFMIGFAAFVWVCADLGYGDRGARFYYRGIGVGRRMERQSKTEL